MGVRQAEQVPEQRRLEEVVSQGLVIATFGRLSPSREQPGSRVSGDMDSPGTRPD